jgi:DNA mismatch endonuclease (patch repair protein)
MRRVLVPSFSLLEPSSPAASRTLSKVVKTGTSCERLLTKELRRRRIRFKVNAPDVPGKPDVLFESDCLAVFCDGDFWHGRAWRQRRSRLSAGHNADYWTRKIARNIQRDREINHKLKLAGWGVLRIWESDIRKDPQAAAAVVQDELRKVRSQRRMRRRIK